MNLTTLSVVWLFSILCTCTLAAPTSAEWVALVIMIGAGIPHGSFDLRVARAKWRGTKAGQAGIITGYLLSAFSMSALCVFAPMFGLALFLIISVIHFIEGESMQGGSTDLVRGSLFGLGAILLPIGLHVNDAEHYLSYFIDRTQFTDVRQTLEHAALSLSLLMAGLLAFDTLKRHDSATTSERCLCLIAWILLPPLAGFSVWFVGRHSRQHLETCRDMFRAARWVVPLDFAFISLLALAGLTPFAFMFDFSDIDQLFAASICLIAGLTLPHMVVSHGMHRIPGNAEVGERTT